MKLSATRNSSSEVNRAQKSKKAKKKALAQNGFDLYN